VTELPPLREVIARHGLSASKSLGQNFLLDEQLLDRIARIPGSLEGERAYEVGPGPGGLTRALLRGGARVTAVERDRRCLPALAELQQVYGDNLRVIEGDALALDEAAEVGAGAHIVANLPYNVGTALAVRWLGRGDVAALVAVADLDVPAGSGGADRRPAGRLRLTAGWQCWRSGAAKRGSR
jgi:16S rRNA (adenine1518-N6/adenine1519-N6)-dimethyltransferase